MPNILLIPKLFPRCSQVAAQMPVELLTNFRTELT